MHEELGAFKELYPDLSPEELALAQENLDRYLSLAWEIFEDFRLDAQCESALPSVDHQLAVVSRERSIPNKPNHPTIT